MQCLGCLFLWLPFPLELMFRSQDSMADCSPTSPTSNSKSSDLALSISKPNRPLPPLPPKPYERSLPFTHQPKVEDLSLHPTTTTNIGNSKILSEFLILFIRYYYHTSIYASNYNTYTLIYTHLLCDPQSTT